MHQNKSFILLGCLVVGLSGAPLAVHANPTTVTMKLTGVTPEGTNLGGVYTSPYEAEIGGSSTTTAVYCDDFKTHVSIGETWLATVTNMSALVGAPLSTLKFDQTDGSKQKQDYMEAAWLAEQLSGINQKTDGHEAALYSFAIWGVFDPGSLYSLDYSDRGDANGYIKTAYDTVSSLSPEYFSNVNIYTADPQGASQEYLTVGPVPTPEPGTLSLFALGFAAVGLIAYRRKPLRS